MSAAPRLDLQVELVGHTDRVWHACWHPTQPILCTCGGDKTIRVWQPRPRISDDGMRRVDLASPEWICIGVIDDFTARTVRCAEWSPNGRFLACTSFDGKAYVWAAVPLSERAGFDEEETGMENAEMKFDLVAKLEGHESEVKSCAWNAAGTLLATCGRDKSVWIWGIEDSDGDMEVVSVLHGHSQDVKAVKWHPTRDILVSASYDDTIKVWGESYADWVCVDTLTGHSSTVWDVAFNHDGSAFATVSDDLQMILWEGSIPSENPSNVTDLVQYKRAITISGLHTRTIFSVDWARPWVDDEDPRKGLIVSSGADDSIRVLGPTYSHVGDPATAALMRQGIPSFEQLLAVPKAHDMDVNFVRWHHKEPGLLVSTGDDSKVKLWRYNGS